MSDDVTTRFFHWMEAHNISRSAAAELIGVDERSLSTYRSRGLPRKKCALAIKIIADHEARSQPGGADDHRISVHFNDNDFDTVSQASGIVGSTVREFIVKATITKAREEISKKKEHPRPFEHLKVAEDPTPYKVSREKHP